MTTTTTVTSTALPAVAAVDPFCPEVLDDPLPFQAALRDAGPVVHLTRYDDLYGMGRYAARARRARRLAAVPARRPGSACRTSAARSRGVRRALLLEADPPHHDAPRRVLAADPRPAGAAPAARAVVRRRRGARRRPARGRRPGPEFDAMPALAEAFPLRVFPDAVGIPPEGRENLLPYGDHLFNAFGPPQRPGGEGRAARGRARRVGQRAVRPRGARRRRLRRRRSGPPPTAATSPPSRRRWWSARCSRPASTPRSTASAAVLLRVRHPPRSSGSGCAPTRRWRGSRSTRRSAGSRRCRRSSAPPTVDVPRRRHRRPRGRTRSSCSSASANRDPRRWDDPDAFDLDRDPSGHVGFGMGMHQCVGQHVARLEAEALLTALATPRRADRARGRPTRHHNNTMHAFATQPMRLHLAGL